MQSPQQGMLSGAEGAVVLVEVLLRANREVAPFLAQAAAGVAVELIAATPIGWAGRAARLTLTRRAAAVLAEQ